MQEVHAFRCAQEPSDLARPLISSRLRSCKVPAAATVQALLPRWTAKLRMRK